MRLFTTATRAPLNAIALLLTLLLSTPAVNAQVNIPKPAGPRTVTGIVTDTMGIAMGNVDVIIATLRKITRTKEDGTFRLDSVPIGRYAVTARKIGYLGLTPRVVVGPEGGSVHIEMIRYNTVMPSMITIAKAGGLSGIIGDTAYHALPNVKVTVLGGGESAVTDSSGAFFIPLRAGKYMLRLDQDGYARQTIGISIPENEGRSIAAWMVPQQGKSNPMEGRNLFDLNERMVRASPVSSEYYAREDMEKKGMLDLQALARHSANGRITPDCMVTVDGGPRRTSLASLTTSEVEFVEVYQPTKTGGGGVRGVTSLKAPNTTTHTTATGTRPSVNPDCGNLGIIVWLRK